MHAAEAARAHGRSPLAHEQVPAEWILLALKAAVGAPVVATTVHRRARSRPVWEPIEMHSRRCRSLCRATATSCRCNGRAELSLRVALRAVAHLHREASRGRLLLRLLLWSTRRHGR